MTGILFTFIFIHIISVIHLSSGQMTDISVDVTPVPLNMSTVISEPGNSTPVEVCNTDGCLAIASQMLSSMNFSIDPCDDFFAFACDNYIADHPPVARKQFSVFHELIDRTQKQVQEMMKFSSNHTTVLTDAELKAKRLYQQCMNNRLVGKPNVTPLLQFIKSATPGGWPMINPSWDAASFDLYSVLLNMSLLGVQPFFITELVQDVENPTQNLITLGQPTTFASEDTLQSDIGQQVTMSYFEYIVGATRLLLKQSAITRPISAIMNDAMDIVDLEIDLAMAGLGEVEQRDISMLKDKMSLGMLQDNFLNQSNFFRHFTNFTQDLFAVANLPNLVDRNTTVVPITAEVFRQIDTLLQVTERTGDAGKRRLANYIGWQFIKANMAYLTKDFQIVRQEYLQKIGLSANDVTEDAAAVQCAASLRQAMPLAVASIYVRNFVPSDLQPKAAMMITDVKAGFGQMLRLANWMDNTTTITALQKLQNMLSFVANSKIIMDNVTALNSEYEQIELGTTYFETIQSITSLQVIKNLRRLIKANVRPDPMKDAFDITTVNAYNDPIENQIVILAAILQSPFYDPQVPQYLNYGGIGFVIGHEISHGFDDQGSQFDANQLLRDWWTDTTRVLYNVKKGGFVKQYNNFCTDDVGCINGKLTLGENIADNAGIKAAYKAYFDFFQQRVQGEPEVSLPGFEDFSTEQMFFLASGHLWCGSTNVDRAQLLLLTDPHSPARFRVNGPLSNTAEFAQAYQCPVGSQMNPERKLSVW